jgi:tellurite resistance protein TerC
VSSFDLWRWGLFHVFILGMLALDLGVFNRKAHAVKVREALTWSAVWISLALVFCAGIYHFEGQDHAMKWLTAYVVEKSLSVDNIFVFVLIFSYFRVPAEYQHRVLYWGILGAVLMRAFLIAFSVTLVHMFSWMMYLFGLFLVVSGLKFAFQDEEGVHPERNPIFRAARRYLRVTPDYVGASFLARIDSRWYATPLFLVLVVVESTDLLFAVDSIPAVIAVTRDPFIVYTSNIMAILGLRALYFALAGVMDRFHYLKFGLSLILIFIGVKMVLEEGAHHWHPAGDWEMPILWSLGLILGTLVTAVGSSLVFPKQIAAGAPTPPEPGAADPNH